MRVRLIAVLGLLMSGCAGAPSNGGLWVQQGIEHELAFHRVPEQERLAHARTFEIAFADELLARERARLSDALADCPGSVREPLTLSPGNRTRDAIRLKAADDPQRLGSVASLAQADWLLRRGRATGQAQLCDDARRVMSSGGAAPSSALSTASLAYALGLTDDASDPYLAAVYRGQPVTSRSTPRLEQRVDELVMTAPPVEPDMVWLQLLRSQA